MRLLFVAALALSVLTLGLAPAPLRAEDSGMSNLDKIEMYRRIRSSTAKVTADFRDGTVATGTGVATLVCGQNRQIKLVVTNAHVVTRVGKTSGRREFAPDVKVKAWSKDGGVTLDASILYCEMSGDEQKDLAYLLVEDPARAFTVATCATEAVRVGDSVYACGNPQGEEFLLDDGRVLDGAGVRIDAAHAARALCHDAMIERGNSGGGVFNARGELVGINTWLVDGKVAVAQTVKWFFANHRFNHFHGSLTGAVDQEFLDHVAPGQAIRAAVVGTYRCERDGAWMNGAGVEGKESLRREERFPFGAVVMSIGDEQRVFDGAHEGPDGTPVTYARVAICEESAAHGRIGFRLNDDNPLDNEWGKTFDVVYVVRGAAELESDFGIEFAAPTAEERTQHRLWLTGSDASGTSARFDAGARITDVKPGSEAEACGLRVGDYVVGLNHLTGGGSDPRDRRTWKGLLLTQGEPVDAGNLDAVLKWARSTYVERLSDTELTVIRPGMPDDPTWGRYHKLSVKFRPYKGAERK